MCEEQKPRKQRQVKNGLIDIDSVHSEPGVNYSQWIDISKQKIKVQHYIIYVL